LSAASYHDLCAAAASQFVVNRRRNAWKSVVIRKKVPHPRTAIVCYPAGSAA
jgi:hypothetical protein